MRKRVVEETWTETVHVPLYRFGAPPVPGAKVEYSEGESIVETAGWKLKWFPVGTADSTSVEVGRTCTFVASNGAYKEVYVPIVIRVSRMAIYNGDELVGRGYEAQVAPPAESSDALLRRRGIRPMAEPSEDDRANVR
jgi:hypothetical protein